MIILSDVSGVLLHGIDGMEKIICRDYGLDVADSVFRRFRDMNNVFRDLLRGKMSEDEYWRIFFQEGTWPFSIEGAKRMLSENLARDPLYTKDIYSRIVSFPEHIDVLNARTINGRPDIYIVSDNISERVREIKNLHADVFALVTKQFWSYERGRIKSDPGFFPDLLREIGATADEVIFVDDNPSNVYYAQAAGIISICFESPHDLVRQFRKHSIIVN